MINSVWRNFDVFLNNLVHSFNFPYTSHKNILIIENPLPRKICFIISSNYWTHNDDEFEMIFIFGFKYSK